MVEFPAKTLTADRDATPVVVGGRGVGALPMRPHLRMPDGTHVQRRAASDPTPAVLSIGLTGWFGAFRRAGSLETSVVEWNVFGGHRV